MLHCTQPDIIQHIISELDTVKLGHFLHYNADGMVQVLHAAKDTQLMTSYLLLYHCITTNVQRFSLTDIFYGQVKLDPGHKDL